MKENKPKRKLTAKDYIIAAVVLAGLIYTINTQGKVSKEWPEYSSSPTPTEAVSSTPEPVATLEPTQEPIAETAAPEPTLYFNYRSVHLEPTHGTLKDAEVLENNNTLSVLIAETEKASVRMPIEYNYENVIDLVLNQACHVYSGIGYNYYAYTPSGVYDSAISFWVNTETIQGIVKGEINAWNLSGYLEEVYINDAFYAQS